MRAKKASGLSMNRPFRPRRRSRPRPRLGVLGSRTRTRTSTRTKRFMVPMHARSEWALSMNLPLPVSWPERSSGPRPVPGRSAWPAPAARENHRGPRPCAAAAGGDRPRSESDRFMVPMHARSERGLPMSRDSQTRMTNDEIRMTKPTTAQLRTFEHSGFGFHSSFVIRHSSFNDSCKSGSWPQCALKKRRGSP